MLKRIISLSLSLFLIISYLVVTVSANNAPVVSAKSAVLIEADSKDVIFAHNHRERLPMASTTKIMTALVVIDALPLDRIFTVSDEAVGIEGTSAYLKKGDKMTVETALYALLLQSANDAAVALAIETSGSIEKFAALMNEKAEKLGLKDTAFKNPSGLPDEGHYTTAYDLALLGSYAMGYDTFYSIASSKTATVKIGDTDRTFVNHNRLLSMYDGAIGIKTGYTMESGRCLVGACEKDGVRLISVTLDASDDWNAHCNMFDYGLSKYSRMCLCKNKCFIIELCAVGTSECIYVSPKEDIYITLPKNTKITVTIESSGLLWTPIPKDKAIAYAVFKTKNKTLAKIPLYVLTDN